MTVAQALAAHASAQIAAAHEADKARRTADGAGEPVIDEGPPSFAVSWAFEAIAIGMSRSKDDQGRPADIAVRPQLSATTPASR